MCQYQTVAPGSPGPSIAPIILPPCLCGHGRFDLRLDGLQIEACTLLHRWKLYRCLCQFCDLVLDELEPPELIDKPVVIADRTAVLAIVHAGPLVRIET